MIVKKVKSSHSKSKSIHVRDLISYILEPDKTLSSEKVLYSGSRGFITEDLASQKMEMAALAMDAVKSPNPINHYILSWREGEQPMPDQVEEAVTIFMDELGLSGHQVFYGLHADTDNLHLHLAINRVHPDTLKVIKPNGGFDIEVAHKAIARIEHVQGWQREANGRYEFRSPGDLSRRGVVKKQPGQKARDMESRTGEKSAERIALEEASVILRQARSWRDLHEKLAFQGIRFDRKGSGAVLFVGSIAVKASCAGRDCSFTALEKRLGSYEPSQVKVQPRSPEALKPDAPHWRDYITGRKEHYTNRNRERILLKRQQVLEHRDLFSRHEKARQEMFRGSWQGKGEILNALRSVLAAEQAGEKIALKEKQSRERIHLQQKYPRYPDFEEWLRSGKDLTLAEKWRYRDSVAPRIEGEGFDLPKARDIRSYCAEVWGSVVFYSRNSLEFSEGACFVDRGKEIDVYDWHSRDSVLAALQLASQKWGSFTVVGNDDYKALCVRLSAEYGFKINNPELQGSLEAERQQVKVSRAEALKSEPHVWDKSRQIHDSPLRFLENNAVAPILPLSPYSSVSERDYPGIYEKHYKDIVSRSSGQTDLSRIDAMIAVRMRVTGHSRETIASVLSYCAPVLRGKDEKRDWKDYAQRTVRYAFGVGGAQDIQRLEKFRHAWMKLEGRKPVQKEPKRKYIHDYDHTPRPRM